MAKISARGAHKLCDLRSVKTVEKRDGQGVTETYWLFAIRSDGAVLRKYCCAHKNTAIGNWRQDGTYSVLGTVKDPAKRNVEFLAKIMRKLRIEPEGA